MTTRTWTRTRTWIVLALLFVASLLYRWADLGTAPPRFATADEYHYLWTGLSLLEGEKPATWSFLKVYEERGERVARGEYAGREFLMVRPGLDHPPLFSLVAAAYAKLAGAVRGKVPLDPAVLPGEVWDIDLGRARTLNLFFFAATFLLLFQVGRREFGPGCALLALLFYGVLVHAVMHNRLLVTENLTTPLLLANVLALQLYTQSALSRRSFGALTVLLVACAVLCKLVALSQALAIGVLLLAAGRRRDLVWPAAGAVLGVLLYVLYGALTGWQTFLAVLKEHANRFDGLNPWQPVLGHLKVVHMEIYSVLTQLGWIFVLANLFSPRRSMLLSVPIVFLVGHVFFANIYQIYGWHMLPYLPFICLALARGILSVVQQDKHPLPWLALCAFLVPASGQFLIETFWEDRGLIRYGYAAVMGLCLAVPFLQPEIRQPAKRWILVTGLLLLIAREFVLVEKYLIDLKLGR